MQWRALHGCGGSKRGSLRPRRPRQRGLARTGDVRFCFARSLVARPSSRRARERAMAWIRRRRKTRAARRAMKRATIDEVGGPFVREFLGPGGWGGDSGADSTYFRPWVGFGPTPHKKQKHPRVASRRFDQERHASTEVRALPACCLHSDRIFFGRAPIIRLWAPAGILFK
jgi:hypothetical protein